MNQKLLFSRKAFFGFKMSRKSKGINAERDLIRLLWEKGFSACRVAGSGATRFPSPDIIAGNAARKLAIECKTSNEESRYIPKDSIEQLKTFANRFGAEPWIAVRLARHNWLFISLDDLEDTGNYFSITLENAKNKGFLIEELLA